MNIQIAVLCDSAVEYQSRLCILGTFDTIRTHKLPAPNHNVQQLKFVRTGNYLIVIDIDGNMKAEIQLQALQIEGEN